MQKIAFERFGTWFKDTWEDFKAGFGNYILFGLLSFAVFMAFGAIQIVHMIVLMATGAASGGMVGMGASGGYGWQLVTVVTTYMAVGISECGSSGVAIARLHGRSATFADYLQSPGAHCQTVLASAIVMIPMIPGQLILGASGFPQSMITSGSWSPNPAAAMGLLLYVVGFPVMLVVKVLCIFVPALIVDKRMDFWSALRTSADCARRDFWGLAMVMLVYTILAGLIGGILTVCTCFIGSIIITPVSVIFRAAFFCRGYRDYFGLEADRIGATLNGGTSYRKETAQYYEVATPAQGAPPPLPPSQFSTPRVEKPAEDNDDFLNMPPPPE